MTSRCTARCKRCLHEAPRAGFYAARPDRVPGFDDICPRCGSHDVEVITPEGLAHEPKEPLPHDYD
jgi:Zn finger protein HypA/HybF involved in hydrogenase expression